jgi:hypothetical protein
MFYYIEIEFIYIYIFFLCRQSLVYVKEKNMIFIDNNERFTLLSWIKIPSKVFKKN